MEEDIKILERIIATKFNNDYSIDSEDKKAIENLIARNKELEELLEEKTIRLGFENQDNYIPKSRVREKIEEYEEIVKDFEEYWSKDPRQFKKEKCIDYYKIEALKELLQEGEK